LLRANHPRKSSLHCEVRTRPSGRKGWKRSLGSSSPIVTYVVPISAIDTLFAKADLRGANLKGANLAGARVFAVNFSSFSIFKGESCLDDAQQLKDDLQLIKPTYVCRTNLQGADLRAAQLQGANLQYAQLQGANLWDARLQGANLQYAQLQGADLQYAQLQGANLEQTIIGSADFTGANLALSNLRELSLSPLDEKTYEELERVLTHVWMISLCVTEGLPSQTGERALHS
jgi:uncharacterized protein YjbI with pentapeptide repeats